MQKIPPTPLAVSPRDAARLMGVSRSRIYELINAGELPAYKDGSRTLILVADIQAWLAQLRAIPKSGPSTAPLLPWKARKLARQRVLNPEIDSTEPLLPEEDRMKARQRAAEPPPLAEPRQPIVEQGQPSVEIAIEQPAAWVRE
jgi:excisionase family DNA binding protein